MWAAAGLACATSTHGLGARAGLALFRVPGEGEGLKPGLGAMGGGEGLVVAGSFGLGAKGGFFTPVLNEREYKCFQQ